MPAFTLYGGRTFPAVARVTIALDEAGFTDYELKGVDVMAGENKVSSISSIPRITIHVTNAFSQTPEFLAISPYGKVPTLVTSSGAPIYESRAIAKYLARAYPSHFSSLVPDPSDPVAVARFEQAEQLEIAYFSEPMGRIALELFYKQFIPMGPPDMEAVEREKKVVLRHLDVCEGLLGDADAGGFMGGKEFGLVDIFYAPFFARLFDCGMAGEVESRPNVKAWWERVKSRPAVKRYLDESPTVEMYKEMMAKRNKA